MKLTATTEGLLQTDPDEIRSWEEAKEKAEEDKKFYYYFGKGQFDKIWGNVFLETGAAELIEQDALADSKWETVEGIPPQRAEAWAKDVHHICLFLYWLAKQDEFKQLEPDEFKDWLDNQINEHIELATHDPDKGFFKEFPGIKDLSRKMTIQKLGYNHLPTLKETVKNLVMASHYGDTVSQAFSHADDKPFKRLKKFEDNHRIAAEKIGVFLYEYEMQHRSDNDIVEYVVKPIFIRLDMTVPGVTDLT